jgi:competence protein ComEA
LDEPLRRRAVIALAVLALLGVLGGYGFAVRARPKATKVSLGSASVHPSATPRQVFVHVGGAVRRPGVYHLREGSRIHAAVYAAGGATSDADLDSLNLAAKIKDGDKILVPHRQSSPAQPTGGGSGGTTTAAQPQPGGQPARVNINTAPLAELETLPGVGPSIAQRIIDFREKNGGFRKVEDLLEVPGIGPKKFEELKDHVTV